MSATKSATGLRRLAPQAQYNKETHLFSAFAEKSGQQIGGSQESGSSAKEKFFASFPSGKRE